MPDVARSWEVSTHRGPASELHHLDLSSNRRAVHVMAVDRPAVALGSTQSMAVLDPAGVLASGREVTRRRSGGGVVVLDPGEVVWVDVVVPSGDPLWRVDVVEAFVWLGRIWADAVAATTGEVATVHRGAPRFADLGRAVCFAGVGSGEVLVGDRKVVGMSQRRTRDWARFQCLAHGRFDAGEVRPLLATHLVAGAFGRRLGERLDDGVGIVEDTTALLETFLALIRLV